MDRLRIALGVVRGPDGVVWIERGTPPSLGRWALPGGRIEPGEEPLAAARREVREETLLEVTGGEPLAMLVERFEDAAGAHRYDVEVHAFLFADPGGEPVAADGVTAAVRAPAPPSPALEPDRRLAALPGGDAQRIAARVRADGDDLVVLAWEAQLARTRFCPSCGAPLGSFFGHQGDDGAVWCERCEEWSDAETGDADRQPPDA